MPPRRVRRWDLGAPPPVDRVALQTRIELAAERRAAAYLRAREAAEEALRLLGWGLQMRRRGAVEQARSLGEVRVPRVMEPFSVAFCTYFRLERRVIGDLRREFTSRGWRVPHGARRMRQWEELLAALAWELGQSWDEIVD